MQFLAHLHLASLSAGDWAGVVAAALAVVTLALGVGGTLVRWLAYRRLLVEAVYETAHNLYHISRAPFDQSQGVFTAWPEFYVFRATELMASRNLAWLVRRAALSGDIDHMLRNEDQIRRFAFTAEGLRCATDNIGDFVEHAVRLLLHAKELRGGAQVLVILGLKELVDLPSPHVRFRLEEAVEDAREGKHGARNDSDLIYWVGQPPKESHQFGGRALDLGARFEAMQDPPPRGIRPRLPRV